MTEDEKTIKSWAYEKLMSIIYESSHYSKWTNYKLDSDDIVKFIKLVAPDFYAAIQEKIKNEKEKETQDEV